MKHIVLLVWFAMALVAGGAESELAPLLQKGLFEEEANRNLESAIEAYKAAAEQYDKNRRFAATAVLRLGECYRKLGRTNEAAEQYRRVTREFEDEAALMSAAKAGLGQLGFSYQQTAQGAEAGVAVQDIEVADILKTVRHSPDLINVPSTERGITLLQRAAAEGKYNIVLLLLTNGAAVDARQELNHTALHYAAVKGHNAVVELLLGHGADPNATTTDGVTALHLAVSRGYERVVSTLLEEDAKMEAIGFRGGPVVSFVNSIISYSFSQPAITPLQVAVGKRHIGIAQKLIKAGAKVDEPNQQGDTALAMAAEAGNIELVRMLLGAGANPNSGERPPIYTAAASGSAEVLAALLQAGANANPFTQEQISRNLRPAAPNAGNFPAETPLHVAARRDPRLLELLLKAGAVADARDVNQRTPLHFAAEARSAQAVELLLEAKANPNVLDYAGKSPLDIVKQYLGLGLEASVRADAQRVVRILREHGALDEVPRPDRIVVRRGPTEPPLTAVTTNVYYPGPASGFTLMEVLAMHYGLLRPDTSLTTPARGGLPFPDLANLKVRRAAGANTNSAVVSVNLLTGDCASDMPLNWGDQVEIPELPHLAQTPWGGLSQEEIKIFKECLKRSVSLTVHGSNTVLSLSAIMDPQFGGRLWLPNVLMGSGRILSTSDLKRVRVRRASENKEWFVDSTDPQGQMLWLRDGDEIEVVEKR